MKVVKMLESNDVQRFFESFPVNKKKFAETSGVSVTSINRIINNKDDITITINNKLLPAMQKFGFKEDYIKNGT